MLETTTDALERTARRFGSLPALRAKVGDEWQSISWADHRDEVFRVARGCLALGLEAGGGVAILGYNSPRWFAADLGAIVAGGVPTGIYTTSTPAQCTYVAGHCQAGVAVLENAEYLSKLDRGALESLRAIVLMEGESDQEGVYSWADLMALADEAGEEPVRRRLEAQRPDDLCTLIYTSGTTGTPKGVMLSHHNLVWTAEQVARHFGLEANENVVSYLPLSHIAEQIVGLHGPMARGSCTWFSPSLEALGETLREARPHLFLGVPRVWEKIQAAVQAGAAKSPPLRRRILAWARRRGLAGGYADQRGQRRPLTYGLARRLVFAKARQRLGLDRARICATSAAPISLDTLEFFLSLGIPLLEIYGMSECTGPATFSYPHRYRTGKAGFAMEGTEVAVASDGEILMRGPHVFLGYYKNPEATAETLDADGWLHSGDIGFLDDEGFLQVTDRKKELLITAGGKNVAPQPLEAKLKAIPGVSQAVVVGDRRKFISALFTLDPEAIESVSAEIGSDAGDATAAATCERWQAFLTDRVERVNAELARYESIRKFAVLPRLLSLEEGELTPTLKLKRRAILENHAAAVDRLYEP